MKGKIFLFVGIILIGVAATVFFSVSGANLNFHGMAYQQVSGQTAEIGTIIIKFGVPGLLGVLGLIFLILGISGMGKDAGRVKMMKYILQTGADAEGTVTFVDKNFRILINHLPIYSIVEYKFTDMNGQEYVKRSDNVSSEMVVRSGIAVGKKVKVKYLQTDPSQSVMFFA
ncbi:MAG: hypothetical protein HPY53_10425 [Brevinematales bacterium]|nr:hypothetical protein [Brevinematales bacterium]